MLKFRNMVYRRLFWNILIRTILLTLNAVGLGLSLVYLGREDYVTIGLLGILLIIQLMFFVYALNRINRDLTTFFDSVYALDASISFKDSSVSRHFKGLYEKLIKVNSIIGSLKIKLEEQYEYFKRVVNQMPTPIITYYDKGEIGFINEAGRRMFGLTNINNISDLGEVSAEISGLLQQDGMLGDEVIRTRLNGEHVSLLMKISRTNLRDKSVRIASIQNIESELGQKEIESWQRLLKVLTHEIANSIAPISSTIDTLNELSIENWNEGYLDKIKDGLGIIGERSEGLLQLLKDIRRFSSFPQPKMSEQNIQDMLSSSCEILREDLTKEGIEFVVEHQSEHQAVLADRQLISHVLINLITNAKEALIQDIQNTDKRIIVKSEGDEQGFIYLRVIDNGPGISEGKMDQIIIPFYSTKESGSGIGLSISREIMRQHGGALLVNSKPGWTEFTLRFRGNNV